MLVLFLVFPEGCKSYYGIHGVDCLESIWLALGCTKEGRKYPFKLSEIQLAKISSWDLRLVSQIISNRYTSRMAIANCFTLIYSETIVTMFYKFFMCYIEH